MTPFEEHLAAIFDAYNGQTIDTEEAAKLHSYVLTKLAMQEACSKCKEEKKDNIDWDAFRRDAAKDILCAMIANGNLGRYGSSYSEMVEHTVYAADKLIQQLKEDKQ